MELRAVACSSLIGTVLLYYEDSTIDSTRAPAYSRRVESGPLRSRKRAGRKKGWVAKQERVRSSLGRSLDSENWYRNTVPRGYRGNRKEQEM